MMTRHLARTLVILVVAALAVVAVASPAAGKPINSVKELKASCAKGTGTFFGGGSIGACVLKDGGDVICDDKKKGKKCEGSPARKQTEHVRLLLRLLLSTIPSTSGPGGGSGQPTIGGNAGGGGSAPQGGSTTTTKGGSTTTTYRPRPTPLPTAPRGPNGNGTSPPIP